MSARWEERFEVVRRLGRGGYGDVYEVIERRTNRHLALKAFPSTSPSQITAIKSEFRTIRELRHPNLVGIDELLQYGDEWCFTMELVNGEDIKQWFGDQAVAAGSGPRLRLDAIHRLPRVVSELVHAISALHELGQLHLDIKPSNVLVTADDHVVLIDFGLVGSRGLDEQGRLLGTLPYVAPERVAGAAIGPPADWYSVGVLLYELLAGELPFSGSGPALQAAKLTGAHLAPIAWAPPELTELVMQLLSVEPERRPSRAQILAQLADQPGVVASEITASGSDGVRLRQPDEQALTRLCELADRARTSTVFAVLEGGVESDKSATLDALATRLYRGDTLVLRTGVHVSESIAFRGIADLIDALVEVTRSRTNAEQIALLPVGIKELARMFPVIEGLPIAQRMHSRRPVTVENLHEEAALALAEWLTSLSRTQLVVVMLDDLQRWDGDALQLLERVRPHLPTTNLLVVECRRDSPNDFAYEVEVVRLATQTFERQHAEQLTERLSMLAPATRRLLDAIVTSEVPVPSSVAVSVARITARDGRASVRQLQRLSVVVELRGGLVVNDELRHHLLDRMTAVTVIDWRRLVARGLEAAGADPATLARAFHAANLHEQAISYARTAAEHAGTRGAFQLASELWQIAIDSGDGSLEVEVACIESLRRAGHGRLAARRLLVVVDRDPESADEHRRAAGLVLMQVGDIDEGLALLEQTDRIHVPRNTTWTIASLGVARLRLGLMRWKSDASPDPAVLRRVDLLWTVAGALGLVDSMRAALVQTRCSRLALSSGDPARAGRALASEAAFRAAAVGPRVRVETIITRARELAHEAKDPHTFAWIEACRAFVSLLYGDWADVVAHGHAADTALMELDGTHWERAALSHALVAAYFFTGDLGALSSITRRQLSDAQRRGDEFGQTVARVANITLLLATGDLRRAETELDEARRAWPEVTHVQSSFVTLQHANLLICRGDGARALDVVTRGISEMRRQLLLRVPLVRIPLRDAAVRSALHAAAATDEAGQRRHFIDVATKEIARLEREPLAWAHALALLHRGGVAALLGDTTGARAARIDAAARFVALHMPMHAAFARTRASQDPGWSPPISIPKWSMFAALHAP